MPVAFEANQGQVSDAQVQFVYHGASSQLYLTATQSVLVFNPPGASQSAVVSMAVVGANPAAPVVGVDALAAKSNYFIGNDPAKWHTDIPNYAEVAYADVLPGIDLVYHGNAQQQLEYDFVVHPGA